jgi:acetate kinase
MERALALNAGSSSLKFALVDFSEPAGRRLADGMVQRIGADASASLTRDGHAPVTVDAGGADHPQAVRLVLEWLEDHGLVTGTPAVGHRVVHGGRDLTRPVRVDDAVLSQLDALRALAPLHNGPAVAALRAAREIMDTEVAQVATFDTAFHAAMPERAARYAIDPQLADRHGIRRYGFHGLAHRSMLERYAAASGRPADDVRIITVQLGNGCSAAAVRNGRSVDTTMGLTPLEGLVMGTRSGDVDPALVGFLARREGMGVEEVEQLLNHRSGLLGVSGRSSDMRDLLGAAAEGDARAELAVDLFCYRVRKTIGAYLAVLDGADAIVFGGGIGVNSPTIRSRACAGLDWCGVAVDSARNDGLDGEGRVSADGALPEVFVAAVDEESAIARDALGAVHAFATAAEGTARTAAGSQAAD